MKTIGLIGGMSCELTAHYYARLNEGVRAALGGLHSAEILMWSVDFAPIAAMQAQDRWQEAGSTSPPSPSDWKRRGQRCSCSPPTPCTRLPTR